MRVLYFYEGRGLQKRVYCASSFLPLPAPCPDPLGRMLRQSCLSAGLGEVR